MNVLNNLNRPIYEGARPLGSVGNAPPQRRTQPPTKTDAKVLQRRQWSKFLSFKNACKLDFYNPNSTMSKAYERGRFCSCAMKVENGKASSHYCHSKFCLTCNRIKMAKLINIYEPIFKSEFKNPQFVTLTIPTIDAEGLEEQIKTMKNVWRKIYNFAKYRETHKNEVKRSQWLEKYGVLKGVIKSECTIRPNGLYHYHFHLLVDGANLAVLIREKWLEYFPKAERWSQDIRRANKKSLKELFKYSFKLDVKGMMQGEETAKVSKEEKKRQEAEEYKRLNFVLETLKGHRTFSTFGGIKEVEDDFDDDDLAVQEFESIQEADDIENGVYIWRMGVDDWVSLDGVPLVGLPIPDKLKGGRLGENLAELWE